MKLKDNKMKNEDCLKGEINAKHYFREPPISPDLRIWTVAMMKTDVLKTAILLEPAGRGQPEMQNEWKRLATFASFKIPEGIFVIALAGNGFFVPGNSHGKSTKEGQVECAFCSVVVPIVMFIHVKPLDVHRHVSPNCCFVQGCRTGNVSIAACREIMEQFAPALPAVSVQRRYEITSTLIDAELPSVDGSPQLITRQVAPPVRTDAPSTGGASSELLTSVSPSDMAQSVNENRPPLPIDFNVDLRTTPMRKFELNAATASSHTDRETAGTNVSGLERQAVTCEDLGIIYQRPYREDMTGIQTRIDTFLGSILGQSHLKEELALAGFYFFCGYSDSVRCFFCNGKLKMSEMLDTPWVEHARWFPRCPFVKLCKGQRFIDAVHKLNDPRTRTRISREAVEEEMRRNAEERLQGNQTYTTVSETSAETVDTSISTSSTWKQVPSNVALTNNLTGQILRPLSHNTLIRASGEISEASINEMSERLSEKNKEIQNTTMCKMCQTNEVSVLFLPCGHVVACDQCAPLLTTCAMCRQPIWGTVMVKSE